MTKEIRMQETYAEQRKQYIGKEERKQVAPESARPFASQFALARHFAQDFDPANLQTCKLELRFKPSKYVALNSQPIVGERRVEDVASGEQEESEVVEQLLRLDNRLMREDETYDSADRNCKQHDVLPFTISVAGDLRTGACIERKQCLRCRVAV